MDEIKVSKLLSKTVPTKWRNHLNRLKRCPLWQKQQFSLLGKHESPSSQPQWPRNANSTAIKANFACKKFQTDLSKMFYVKKFQF